MTFLFAAILLTAFAVLALIDGFYLHIFKYQLFNHRESRLEHLMHTYRSVLFPLIIYFLFICENSISFYLGLFFVVLDIIVLVADAYFEKDSRMFMGGLPRWEYILHLFVNGFHFAAIAVYLAIKLIITDEGLILVRDLSSYKNFDMFHFIAIKILPGAIVIAIIHVITSIKKTAMYWNQLRAKILCC